MTDHAEALDHIQKAIDLLKNHEPTPRTQEALASLNTARRDLTAPEPQEVELSSTARIGPDTATMEVRGGGLGASAWIALITAVGGRFGLEREFVDRDKALSGSGKSGHISWDLPYSGVYEYRDLCVSTKDTESGFVHVDQENRTVRAISRRDIDDLV